VHVDDKSAAPRVNPPAQRRSGRRRTPKVIVSMSAMLTAYG
jgi:hypothetical protein